MSNIKEFKKMYNFEFEEIKAESFEEIEKYLEQRINIIEKKVEETLNTEKKNLDICMTVMNEEEYRLNDGVFSPVDMVDFSDKTKKKYANKG